MFKITRNFLESAFKYLFIATYLRNMLPSLHFCMYIFLYLTLSPLTECPMSEPGEPDLQESNALAGLRARSHAGTSGVLETEEEEEYSDHNSYDSLCHELETLLEDQTACDAQVTEKPLTFVFVAKNMTMLQNFFNASNNETKQTFPRLQNITL